MHKSLLIKLFYLICVLIAAAVILRGVDFRGAYKLLINTNPLYILLFIGLSTTMQILKTCSYYFLLKESEINLSFFTVLKIFFASQIMTFLPGGEVGRVALTRLETRAAKEKSAASVLSQAFVELLSVIIVVIIGSFYFNTFRLAAFFSLVILFFIMSIILSDTIWKHVKDLLSKVSFLHKHIKKINSTQDIIRNQVFQNTGIKINPVFILVMAFSIMAHIVGGILIFALSRVYNLNLNVLSGIFVFSVGALIQGLLAIIPAGLGVTEGGMIGILLSFGNTFNKSLALILMFRIVGFVYYVLLGLIVFLIFYSKKVIKLNYD